MDFEEKRCSIMVYSSQWWEWAEKEMNDKLKSVLARMATASDAVAIYRLQGEYKATRDLLNILSSKKSENKED